ncbi:hypothetical protein MTO96_039453, partial [Rhipicephalus appendiculatus]
MAVGYQSAIDVNSKTVRRSHRRRAQAPPRKYPHTVILRPKQPCRIMDEQFIRLDRVITRHISAHLDLSEEDPLPEFTVRYLGRSNQLAVDAAEPEVRNALLAIASLPLSGKDVPFHAYEARTLLVFRVYVVPENTRNKSNKAPVDLSFISHFKKLYPQDTILLCGDFNSQHVAWGYNQCSPRGRRIMQDASEYRLTLLNTPQTHTRLAQTARQADTSPDLTWSTRPQLFQWEVLDDCMGSDHFPILIHFRTGYANTKKPNATTRLSHITHWDKYREFLQQQPPAKNIDHLVSQLCAAKRKATKNLRVPFDHPEPDRHLLTLWNRRLWILAQYRRSGHAAHHKARLRKIQRTIEEYTTTLASDRWIVICEFINGQTHTSKVWAILRSLLGQRKTYNGAARVALREGISGQELAEQGRSGQHELTDLLALTPVRRRSSSCVGGVGFDSMTMATGKTPDTYASVLTSQHAPSDAPVDLSGPGASTDAHDQHVKIPIEVLLQIGAALSSNPCGRVIDAHADASPTTASGEKRETPAHNHGPETRSTAMPE